MTKNKISRTCKATAQRIDAAYQFDMSPVAAAASTGTTAPDYTSIPVLPPSGSMGRDGRGPFTYTLETVVANVRANGADIPIFLDHETGQAYGWIDHLADPTPQPDGSYEWPVRYTAAGLALVSSEAYRYNSPTWLYLQNPAIPDRQAGEIVGVLENSLVNLPNQPLRSLNAADSQAQGGYTVNIPTESDQPVTPEQLAALGLTPTATAEEVLAAINALTATATSATAKVAEIATAAGAPADADVAAVVEAAANSRVVTGALVTKQAFDEVTAARDAAVSAQASAVKALGDLQAAHSEQAATTAVDAAIAAGRFPPAAREVLYRQARNDFKGFTDLAAVSTHAVLNTLATPAMDDTFGLSAENLAFCKQHSINPEIYAKNLRASA